MHRIAVVRQRDRAQSSAVVSADAPHDTATATRSPRRIHPRIGAAARCWITMPSPRIAGSRISAAAGRSAIADSAAAPTAIHGLEISRIGSLSRSAMD